MIPQQGDTKWIVHNWNIAFQPGTPVIYENDMGEDIYTKTRSIAWMLGCRHPVVMIEDYTGCVSLFRIRAQSSSG